YGTNGLLYNLTINKVQEVMLHANGWCFPFISHTITMDYEGLSNYRATVQIFDYDTATGNLTRMRNLGEVTDVSIADYAFNDVPGDSVYTHIAYDASLGEVLNKPSSIKITS